MRYVTRQNKGFTLVELLVVMAISVILMGLILYPVYQSFVITRQAQAMVESQDAARTALHMISRELGQAMVVFDNAQAPLTPFGDDLPPDVDTSAVATPIMLPVRQPSGTEGRTQWFVLPYAKIDFILPKLYMHCNNPYHPPASPRDYPRNQQKGSGSNAYLEMLDWPECPYCLADQLLSTDVEARPKTPLEQDVMVVRYFLALRRNDLGVSDPPGYPLNKGWVSPWGKNVEDGTQNQVILYRAEFNPYDDTLFPAGMSISERLQDPLFFYRPNYAKKWMETARVVGIGKFEDLVTATRAPDDTVLSVQPTVTFRTASIENDTFAPATDVDRLNDYPGAPAHVFVASYGYWTPGSHIEVMRGDYCENPPSGVDFYTAIDQGDLVIMRHLPGETADTVEFNITKYYEDGYVQPDSAGSKPLEMAFTIDPNRGTVNFALQPPRVGGQISGPVCVYNPRAINQDFHNQYSIDRYGARRSVCVYTQAVDSNGSPLADDQYLRNSRVVPGSDIVIGPNMVPGPDFGKPVRYERIPLGLRYPGQNQYQIDCDSGWIMFSPDPSLDLPETGDISVYYKIYFNRRDDVVRGDYLTKSLINIQMGMRMFDPDQGKPYPVDLTNSVKIRNARR